MATDAGADPSVRWVYVGDELGDLLRELGGEVERQDQSHPAGFPATRDGLRLGIGAIQDEYDEARDAHRAERRRDGWPETRMELLQLAAVAVRMVRSIDEAARRAVDGDST